MRALISVDLPAPLSPITDEDLAREQVDVDTVEADDPAEGLDQATTRQHRVVRVGEYRRVTETDSALLFLGQFAAFGSAGHAFTFLIHWSIETATMTSTPVARSRHWSSTPARLSPMLNTSDDQCTEDGADDAASATEQAGAADHHGGDAVQVGVDDRVGTRRAGPADQHPAGDAVDQPRHRVDAEQHPVDPDTDQAGRLGVVAHGIHVPTPRGLAEHERQITAMIATMITPVVIRNGPIEDRVARPVQDGGHLVADRLCWPPE